RIARGRRNAARGAAGLHRRAGRTVRLLHQWLDHERRGAAARQPACERGRNPPRALGPQVPLRDPHEHPAGGEARAIPAGESLGGRMDTNMNPTRREFLKASGALVVSFAMPGRAAEAAGGWPAAVDATALDSWLRVAADGTVTACVGKIEAGMGISTAFTQMVAEELDVPMARITLVMGDTAGSVDQRGTGGSNGIQDGGSALRRAGAEARHALVALAAERLHAEPSALRVRQGVVYVANDPSRSVSYGDLLGGRRFEMKVGE